MRAALAAAVLLAVACGSQQQQSASLATVDEFECKDRRAEYALTGGFVAIESGIAIYCDGDQAFLDNWRVTDDTGTRKAAKHELSQVDFEALWKKIESAGWRFLEDCDNPEAADDDPVYTIDVRDHAASVSLTCQGKTLPFPYDRLVNELDLKAAGFTQ